MKSGSTEKPPRPYQCSQYTRYRYRHPKPVRIFERRWGHLPLSLYPVEVINRMFHLRSPLAMK